MNQTTKNSGSFSVSETFYQGGVLFAVDADPKMQYEKTKWIYYFASPLMYLLGFWVMIKKIVFGKKIKTNTFWFDGASPVCREIKENAQGWRAVDILYNHCFCEKNDFSGKLTDFWLKMINSQAMRNRLKLVKQCLRAEIETLIGKDSEIRIFSIASGSAQAVVEVMSEYKHKSVLVKACLLDLDAAAISHGRQIAEEVGVSEQIQYINKNAREADNLILNFNPHIVEVVGFLEYRPKDRTIELINRVYRVLSDGSVLFTSTITPNIETFFLHWVVDWPMIYRTPRQFAEILKSSLFKDIKVICEPLKIQKIAICRK